MLSIGPRSRRAVGGAGGMLPSERARAVRVLAPLHVRRIGVHAEREHRVVLDQPDALREAILDAIAP